jgi:signal transduction histidine kinase/CheY-like chemotaxis protein/HPt (histidine-containing phosphotransfer) domain-containing protein
MLSLWLVLFCLQPLTGTAEPVGPAFVQQFGPAEGLAQPFIYCLLQDRQGYLWLGTAEGLVRYDGSRFVTFTTREGLAENFVTGLWQDPATGRLWVTHYGGRRSVRLAPGQAFRPAAATLAGGPPPTAAGPPTPDTARLGAYQRRYALGLPPEVSLTCLLEDREGNTWLGTAGQGLWRHSDRYLSLLAQPARPSGETSTLVSLPAAMGRHAWGTFGGLSWFQLPAFGTQLQWVVSGRALPASQPVQALLPRPASLGGGLWLAAGNVVSSTVAPGAPAQPVPALQGVINSAVTALAYAPGSGLWVGTAADGIYLVPTTPATGAAPPVQHFTTANGLLHNSIVALLADRRGRVWVATHNTGLVVWNPTHRQFAHLRLNAAGLDASTLAQTDDGTIWVGTEGQGLYYRLAGATAWQHLTASKELPDNYLTALLPLPATGRRSASLLLVHPQGLSLLDLRRRVASPLASTNNPLVQSNLPAVALATGSVPLAWVATRAGLLRLDLSALARRPVPPGLALSGAEVDGEPRAADALGELSAQHHRVSFVFQGISLAPAGASRLRYRYRLRGLAEEWSRPSAAGEAQFAGLGPGRYLFETQVRRPGAGWSPSVTSAFTIATPWWQQAWAIGLGLALLVGSVLALVRVREGALRRQKFQLEHTVRERTAELRQQKSHIEIINSELLVARDAAEASRRAKAQFLANMSHEIRTPMNAVIGLTNLLQHTAPTPEQGEYLTAINSSSQNLLVILNDILDSSKMEAGKLSLEQVAFRLPEAVRGLSTMFRYAADSKGLRLQVQVDEAVPEAIVGDPVRLQQVLVNLVSNALKFTRQGGVTVAVSTLASGDVPAGHVALRFAVRDTGIGIPADKLTAIFEDFSQANASTTREYGGTGLGLSIARNLVQLHGGQLGVHSEEGVGSEFYFELTYPVANAAQTRPSSVMGPLPAFEPALRVLVAEDNQLNQLVARKTLENWNVQVVIAENGRLAVEQVLAATTPFDAIFMDIQMPELDGYAAARALRQHFPDAAGLPIIGLTASVLPEDRTLALAAGMNDILAKPFEPAMLYARLAHFTGRLGAASDQPAPTAEAQPSPTAAPALRPNWQQLEELAGGNAGFIKQIVNTFLTEAPALEQLLAAAYPHDPAGLASLAHKLKGQVAYFGVPLLHAQLDELERSARQPECPYCEPLLATVRQQLGQLYPLLHERA